MDKDLIETVARTMHETLRHTSLWHWSGDWDLLDPEVKSEYRAVAHSCLVASSPRRVWIVTDESRIEGDEQNSSVIAIGTSREEVMALLADVYDGAEECVWKESGGVYWTTQYGDIPLVLAELLIPWGN